MGVDEVGVAVASRTLEGIEVPAPGTWTIDPSHSTVGFSVRHLMVSKVRGRFGAFTGSIEIGERPEDSSVEVAIEAASIDTRDERRDAHLRSGDFLDAERHPALAFRSTGLRPTGGRRFHLDGALTIRGVTRPVTLEAELDAVGPDPWGGTRAGFTASTEIDREQWGLTWNQALETGGVLVGKQVRIEIEAQVVRAA